MVLFPSSHVKAQLQAIQSPTSAFSIRADVTGQNVNVK